MFTTEQELAIRTEGKAMIVEAGAGTGKTTVLTQRFLHLLARHPEWPIESIVAVTFTEKAANEMRSRIRAQIENLASANPDSHWQQRRLEADRLQVSTIHSLCARILRENALSAALDPRFAVLDEIDALLLREEAIGETLQSLAGSEHPSLELLEYVDVRTFQQELSGLLQRRGTVEPLFQRLAAVPDLLRAWRQKQRETWSALWQAGPDASALEQAMAELPHVVLPSADDKLIPHVEAAQRGLNALGRGDWPAAVAEIDSIKLNAGRAALWGGKDALDELRAMLSCLRDAARRVKACGASAEALERDATAAQLLHWWREVWDLLTRHYDDLKDARNGLDFTDLERLTLRMLLDPSRSRRLQAYIDGIQQLMVDEYQDTNPAQRDIIYALAQPQQPRFFVVGDAKQSIYRFREADVSVYHHTRVEIETANGVIVRLRRSFRSHQRLVMAVNHLFAWLFAPSGAVPAPYEAVHGALESEEWPPLTEAVPYHVEMVRLPRERVSGEKVNAEEGREWEAREIAQRLARCEGAGTPVRVPGGKSRPFRFGDAAILLRSFSDVYLYEEALKAAGVPFITVGGRGYFNRPEIEDLLSLLRALDNPADDLSLGAVLRSPLFCLSDETLFTMRWYPGASVKSAEPIPFRTALRNALTTSNRPPVEELDAVQHAGRVLQHLWALRGRVEVWELLQSALTATGYLAVMALADQKIPGSRQRRNVEKLLELARSRGGASLSSFVQEVQTRRVSDVREGEAIPDPEAGVVQIMTIHAAKGLEFPLVVLADLGRDLNFPGRGSSILANAAFGLLASWQDGEGKIVKPASYQVGEFEDKRMEAAENKRLLYVACTRAADWLWLFGQKGKSSCWLAHMAEAWDIPETISGGVWEHEFGDFCLRVTDLE